MSRYDYPTGGKGDTRIPSQIPDEEMERRWEKIFGHLRRERTFGETNQLKTPKPKEAT